MYFFSDLMITALYTAFFQNLVLTLAYGTSEAIRVSLKPKSFGIFAAMVSGFSVVTAVICYPLDRLPAVASLPLSLHTLVYGAVLSLAYLIVAFVMRVFLKASDHFMTNLGIAALNSLVLAIPFVNRRAAYSFGGCVGSGLGAGIAFVVAAAFIADGVHRLSENKEIPPVFKGTPAMFLYVGLLSLGFSAFSGNSIFS